MNKKEIELKIREKYDDEYTIKMFTNFVLEFQECFSDIMPAEVVIERIKKNIDGNIVIKDEFQNASLDGRYDDGHIYLKKTAIENERYTKYLLFHEMLHAITTVRDENGNDIKMGFSYLTNGLGMGFNEAMTEYLTQIRNEKFEENRGDLISGYRTIVEQIRRLSLIIGDEELKQAYFYNPENLKNILSKNNMNYDELDKAFVMLAAKDHDVNAMARGIKLENNSNYVLPKFAETIFLNYSKALGRIKSIEDFKKKYQIFQTYTDGQCDCIGSMFLIYYQNMGKDIEYLLRQRVSLDDIKKALQELKLNINGVSVWYDFSKCLVQDKNQSAINVYEFYNKNPQAYFEIFAKSYGSIFDHFAECDSIPGDDSLYNGYTYIMIGRLLKDHPEIDYSDVSYDVIEEKHSKTTMYIFSSSKGKKYAYTLDGKACKRTIEEDGSEAFEFRVNDKCTGKFLYQKDGHLSYSFHASKDFDIDEFTKSLKFKQQHFYSPKEDIEYWREESGDEDGYYLEILNRIEKRMKSRREWDFFDT